jgi:hypothetical protein
MITANIIENHIIVADRNDMGLVCEIMINEDRPATFAAADAMLAAASLRRTSAWDLDEIGGVSALVAKI